MALPDPLTLTSSQEAFTHHPLPAIRQLSHQLHHHLDTNRAQLRSLVGASYRDLLGTAERIVEMDVQIRAVEGELGGIGRRCQGGVVGRMGKNLAGLRVGVVEEEGRRRGMAGTKVLEGCLRAAGRGMRRGGDGDALEVGKLVVLGRVLCKSLVEGGEAPAVVHEFGRRLAGLRRKLLGFVERSIRTLAGDRTALVRTLCAYALVTSSSAKDVLRHFLQVRAEEIESQAETATESGVLQVLELYRKTLGDARALFPRMFAESLSRLGKSPLLQDAQVRALTELNLDVYGVWIAADVQGFTPWVRHEALLASGVNEGLAAWSKHVQGCVLGAVTAYLASETDVDAVLSARKKVLSRYLALLGGGNDAGQSQATGELRSVFLARLSTFAVDCAQGGRAALEGATVDVGKAVTAQERDIWQLASRDFDISHGALQLRQAVLQRRHGRDGPIQPVCERLDAWVERWNAFWEVIQRMRSTKWDGDLDYDFDDLDDGDTLLDALVKEDPEWLCSTLQQATTDTIRQMYEYLQEAFDAGGDAAMLVRLLREVHRRQRILAERTGMIESGTEIPTALFPALHRKLAEDIVTRTLKQHTRRQKKQADVPVSLWDGSPLLPVQPSPATFRLLTLLQRTMAEMGSDLWTSEAVDALKATLEEKLPGILADSPSEGGELEATTNGHGDEPDESEAAESSPVVNGETRGGDLGRRQRVQLLFDALYLQRILRRLQAAESAERQPRWVAELAETAELDTASMERLAKSANEYWKRTYLLFALLAPHAS
ncbi:hypothetical protein LTR01_006492 [Friedmanniomyces endolithicus]|nr:hypothetical protein LTR01_006492 [Friedmanniomyces endolithicus]KAK0828145.1 hypothetical protein LTR73_005098 [Friedmanniomyces endolithicus]